MRVVVREKEGCNCIEMVMEECVGCCYEFPWDLEVEMIFEEQLV